MMLYSVQPRDRVFVKDYGFLSFAKNMGKSICKNINKYLIIIIIIIINLSRLHKFTMVLMPRRKKINTISELTTYI